MGKLKELLDDVGAGHRLTSRDALLLFGTGAGTSGMWQQLQIP